MKPCMYLKIGCKKDKCPCPAYTVCEEDEEY